MTAEGNNNIKNIYARGADDGFLLGVYFVAMLLLSALGFKVPAVNLLASAMAVGVPVLCYIFMRRSQRAAHGLLTFSALWMHGIVTFACGSLIFGAAGLVYLKWIDPQFLLHAIDSALEFYRNAEGAGAQAAAEELEMIKQNSGLISPLNVAFGWMWLGMFSGSLLSMLVAGLVKLRKPGRYK